MNIWEKISRYITNSEHFADRYLLFASFAIGFLIGVVLGKII